jgi:hypothetical protein
LNNKYEPKTDEYFNSSLIVVFDSVSLTWCDNYLVWIIGINIFIPTILTPNNERKPSYE